MKKIWVFPILVLLLVNGSMAQTIDLTYQNQPNLESDLIAELNSRPLTHALIDGYSSIAIEIDDIRLIVHIEEDNITSIERNRFADADYTIKSSLAELAYIYLNRNSMSRIEMLRILVTEKDIPLRVILRIAGLLIKGGQS